jgi:glycosyltransferase involved in cell wall biosynthesis
VKSVLITSNAYYPNIGGVENSLRYLATSYVSLGYRVYVVVSDVNSINDSQLPKFELLGGVHIYRYSSYADLSIWIKPLRGLLTALAMFRLFKHINKQQPFFTLSRFHSSTLIAKWAGLANVTYLLPGVVRFQNKPSQLSKQTGLHLFKQKVQFYLHDWVQQLAMRSADKLAVFSTNMREQVCSCFKKDPILKLLKPGVDNKRFSPLPKNEKIDIRVKLELPVDKVILLIVGRFVRAKGIRYALQALLYLPNCHLLLVGGGEEESLYRDYVRQNNLMSQVTFAGVQQDPVNFYQCSDLFLMTSVYEPLGQTILEGLSSGLPVVAFTPSTSVVTATRELLECNEALFVDELSADALARTISNFIDNKNNADNLGERSREIAIRKFSWSRLARQLIDD